MRRNDEVLQQDQQVRFEDVNSYAVIGKELARTKRYVDYEATLLGSNKKREVRWFFPDGGQDSQYKRIHVMLEKRSPSDHFRWPLATTCADTNGFGVLLYRRKGAALADVALGPQRPESLRTRIDIALEIVSRFSELHGSRWALEGFDGHELTVDIKNSWRAIFDDCGSVVRQDAVEDSERFDVAGDSWTRFAKQSESPDNGHGRVPARKARDRCRRQRRGRTARSSRWPWRWT